MELLYKVDGYPDQPIITRKLESDIASGHKQSVVNSKKTTVWVVCFVFSKTAANSFGPRLGLTNFVATRADERNCLWRLL